MGGRMYLGNQMVTPVIVDYKCSFGDITGEPTDNEALAHALDEKQNVISDLDSIRSGASAGSTALQPSALNGYATESWVTGKGYITGINSTDVVNALGFTPYDASNPSGYTSNTGTVTSVNNTSPVNGNVTISIPTVNDATITFTQGGETKGSFTTNQSGNTTISLDAGGSGGDDWGQSLQGDVVVNNTFICVPYKCDMNNYITSFSAPNVTRVSSMYYTFGNCGSLTTVSGFTNLTTAGKNSFYYCFSNCASLTTVPTFSSLTRIDNQAFSGCFVNCTSLTTAPTFANVVSVGDMGLQLCFGGCASLTTGPTFASLTSVSKNGLASCFSGCSSLTTITFNSLAEIGDSGLSACFGNDHSLQSISFPALTTQSFGGYTNQFNSMLLNTGTSVTHTLHFPSNLESTIQGLTGYPNFGGTSGYVVLAFDLPETT